ncbi:MAG: hypothetical protein QM802_00695 [Agriterribacter sp.]
MTKLEKLKELHKALQSSHQFESINAFTLTTKNQIKDLQVLMRDILGEEMVKLTQIARYISDIDQILERGFPENETEDRENPFLFDLWLSDIKRDVARAIKGFWWDLQNRQDLLDKDV